MGNVAVDATLILDLDNGEIISIDLDDISGELNRPGKSGGSKL